jgi:hypothetical protein
VVAVDGHDADAINKAIEEAKAVTDKPSLICCKTTIGFMNLSISTAKFAGRSPAIRRSNSAASAGNSGISRVLCNANNYRSIHEGLFFNSSPALDLKYPLKLPYIQAELFGIRLSYH